MKYFFIAFIIGCSSNQNTFHSQLEQVATHEKVLSSQGQYIMLFNQSLKPYIEQELNRSRLQELEHLLAPSLNIELTPQNFTKAAERFLDNRDDDTNYDAVWVRDNAWIYFGLKKSQEIKKATKLILALWDYYSSKAQIKRFQSIIDHPSLARTSKMNVPHIRFNGSSASFEDVMENGKAQHWNHRQNDAHGLFLLALSDAILSKQIQLKDQTGSRLKVLKLFPKYFNAIDYANFKGAGAWEEVDKINTSSIAMVVKAFENWNKVDKKLLAWSPKLVKKIIDSGYQTINTQLMLGGESPIADIYDPSFRLSDAALFNLFLPWPLEKLKVQQKRHALALIEKLVRPFGVIRYENDSYQAGNYWIKPKDSKAPELTGDASSNELFLLRFKNLIPNTEAQWFFDSKISMIYSQMYQKTKNQQLKKIAKYKAIYHFRRALGQITGAKNSMPLAADGKFVRNFQVPESINTVIFNNKKYYVASPITPLNWAKASLKMALVDLKQIF